MYRETTWTQAATAALLAVAAAGLAVLVFVPGDLAAVGLIALLLGVLGALTCYSIGRYSGVKVSTTHLVVGRERVELSRLDRAFGVQDGTAIAPDVLAKLSHIAFSGQVTPARWRAELDAEGVELLGGSYGVPAGYTVLVVREAGDQGRLLAFASLHPERTATALTAALAP